MNHASNLVTLAIMGCVGLVVAVVSARVLREFMNLGRGGAWTIAFCGALLAMIGLTDLHTDLIFLCIPWSALGITLLLLFLLWPFFGGARDKGSNRGEQPEARARKAETPSWQQQSRCESNPDVPSVHVKRRYQFDESSRGDQLEKQRRVRKAGTKEHRQ